MFLKTIPTNKLRLVRHIKNHELQQKKLRTSFITYGIRIRSNPGLKLQKPGKIEYKQRRGGNINIRRKAEINCGQYQHKTSTIHHKT